MQPVLVAQHEGRPTMSNGQNIGRDADKRAAKRRARKEAIARGAMPNQKQAKVISASQAAHASSNRAKKHAAEGEKKMERETGG